MVAVTNGKAHNNRHLFIDFDTLQVPFASDSGGLFFDKNPYEFFTSSQTA